MNVLESYTLENPYGKSEECAKLDIYDTAEWFVFSDIATVGMVYTFSAWIKSDATGSMTVGESYFTITTEWTRYTATFTADDIDLKLIFSTPGTYYFYHSQLELGNTTTDWDPSPEDMASADDVNNSMAALSDSISSLVLRNDAIEASVESLRVETIEPGLQAVEDDITRLTEEVSAKMSSEAVEIQIKSALDNGVTKVTTETGFTFNDDGLTVEKSGSEMKTQITEDGMIVYQNEESVLVANNHGVDAKNLHATTFLIVGGRSRFENYGTNRTGCFWIGG